MMALALSALTWRREGLSAVHLQAASPTDATAPSPTGPEMTFGERRQRRPPAYSSNSRTATPPLSSSSL